MPLSSLPTHLAHLALSYVPSQDFSGQVDMLTPEEHDLANSFRQLTVAQLCEHAFGQCAVRFPDIEIIHANLLKFCYDPKKAFKLKTKLSLVSDQKALHIKNFLDGSSQPLYERLMKIQKQREVLDNYRPENAIQLKNLLQTFKNLQTQHIRYVKFYEQHLNVYRKFYNTSLPGFHGVPNSWLSKNEGFEWMSFTHTTYFVAGQFFSSQKEYEVRACHSFSMMENVGKTHFYIAPAHAAHASGARACPSFSVCMGNLNAHDQTGPRVESLEITLESPPQDTLFKQELTQVMLEIMHQTATITTMHLHESDYDLSVSPTFDRCSPIVGTCFTRDQFNQQTLLNNCDQIWGQTIANHPILYPTSGLIPECWFDAPDTPDNTIARRQSSHKKIFYTSSKQHAHRYTHLHVQKSMRSLAKRRFIQKHFPYV